MNQTASIYNGINPVSPKFAAISCSSSGNNTLVAAVTGKKIRVLAYVIVHTLAVTTKFKSSTAGTDLTGAMPAGINGTIMAPFCPVGYFETASGEALTLVLGSAIAVGGHITYVEV